MLVAVSEMWPLKQWNSDLWLATTPATEHLQEPIRSNLVRAASLTVLQQSQYEGPWGRRWPSFGRRTRSRSLWTLARVVRCWSCHCYRHWRSVSQLHDFSSLWGHLCTYLLLCLPLFFPLPFSMSNKARDMASGLASMATLFKNKRDSSDTSATANVWAQNL